MKFLSSTVPAWQHLYQMKPLKDQIFRQIQDVVMSLPERCLLAIPMNRDGRLADRQPCFTATD